MNSLIKLSYLFLTIHFIQAIVRLPKCNKYSGMFNEIQKGFKLVDKKAITIRNVANANVCIGHCMHHNSCKTISFSKRNNTCLLHSSQANENGDNLTADEDWNFYSQSQENKYKNAGPVCFKSKPYLHGTCNEKCESPGYECSCDDCYHGKNCDKYGKSPFCEENNPWCNNGTCENDCSETGYKCVCDDCYYGKQCNNTYCEEFSPCDHGICIDQCNDYQCECEACYEGDGCENHDTSHTNCGVGNICAGDLCEANCVSPTHVLTCKCDAGTTNENCRLQNLSTIPGILPRLGMFKQIKITIDVKPTKGTGTIFANAWPVTDKNKLCAYYNQGVYPVKGKILYLKNNVITFNICRTSVNLIHSGTDFLDGNWHVGIRHFQGKYELLVDGGAKEERHAALQDDESMSTYLGYGVSEFSDCRRESMAPAFEGEMKNLQYDRYP